MIDWNDKAGESGEDSLVTIDDWLILEVYQTTEGGDWSWHVIASGADDSLFSGMAASRETGKGKVVQAAKKILGDALEQLG